MNFHSTVLNTGTPAVAPGSARKNGATVKFTSAFIPCRKRVVLGVYVAAHISLEKKQREMNIMMRRSRPFILLSGYLFTGVNKLEICKVFTEFAITGHAYSLHKHTITARISSRGIKGFTEIEIIRRDSIFRH